MKRILLILTLALAVTASYAGFKPGYYDRLDGKKRETLKKAVKECVSSHKELNYYALPDYWITTDIYPELVDGLKRWWDMYSDEMYLIQRGQSGRQSFSSYGMQREHSVPKSWWKKGTSVEYTPAYSDMWNLYPSNGPANQAKLNYPFGPTSSTTFNNGVSKVGPPQNGYGGGASRVFEPADEYKGDFARSMFYMACVYDDINWVINYMYRAESYPTLTQWACNMLLQWARQDPVSQKEIDRNNLVEQCQGNRNPFVDFPELAEYVWGLRTTEVFKLSEQEGSDPTPPITGDPTLTQPVNGEALDFGTVAVNHSQTRVLQIRGANFTEPLSLRVLGTDKDLFKPEVASIPASTLNANGGYLLNITYLPTSLGSHEARLSLYDGGLSGSGVVVNLSGRCAGEPSFQALTALPATEITNNSYRANWEEADGVADYYIVTRVRYVGDDQETETYETGDLSLLIEDRDPNVAESYTVAYSRLGMTSEQSNTIYVAAGDAGVLTVEYNLPYRSFGLEGSILILTADGNPVEGLSVCDMSGRVITTLQTVPHETTIEMPAGVYLLTAPGHRPHKVLVR